MAEQLETFQTMVPILKKQKDDARTEVLVAQKKNERLVHSMELLQRQSDSIAEKLKTQKGKEKIIGTFHTKIQDLEIQLQSLSQENHKLKEKIKAHDEWREKVRSERRTWEKYEKEARRLSKENEKLEGSLVHLSDLLDQARIERDHLNVQLYQIRVDRDELHTRYMESREECETQKTLAKNLEFVNSILEGKFKEVERNLYANGPEFFQCLREADKEIRANIFWSPPAVNKFIDMCMHMYGQMASNLKRKRGSS